MTPKRITLGIISSIVFLEILSLATMDSIVPWAVVSHPSIWLRILGWYLMVQAVIGLLGLVHSVAIWGDKVCPICNKDLRTFSMVYGNPVICPKCRSWFHKNCLLAKKNRCPICHPEDEDGTEIPLDFTSLPPGVDDSGR
jgi:hypothetical protein